MDKQEHERIWKETQKLTRAAADKGELIKIGWEIFKTAFIPKEASPEQIHDMRTTFFAGAQHTYACMLQMLSDGDGEDPRDELRMEKLNKELEAFRNEMVEYAP